MSAGRVGIVVLNWNAFETTRRCLDSLELPAVPACTIYLVDNGSSDGSMDRLEALPRRSTVFIRNGANLGFAAGCNRGIARALSDGCAHVLLLNNDCISAGPELLGKLVSAAEAEPRVGIVGGRILRWPAKDVLWSVGGRMGWGKVHYLGLDEPDRGQYADRAEREFVSGALMLVRREVFEVVGLLPEAYFFGHEDWEHCLRARQRGFRIFYEPGAVVYHEAEGSHAPASAMHLYNDALSRILFVRRNLSAPSRSLWLALFSLYASVLLPLKMRLQPASFTPGVSSRALQFAWMAALRDGARVKQVTAAQLEWFRADYERRAAARTTR